MDYNVDVLIGITPWLSAELALYTFAKFTIHESNVLKTDLSGLFRT